MNRAAPYDREIALDQAMDLFWRQGYHATSLKDLEACLNMKPGSIYAAFQSKENLYLLTLERYFHTARSRFRQQIAKAQSPITGLADHLRNYAKLKSGSPQCQACMLTKTLMDTKRTAPEIADKTRDYFLQLRQEFQAVFERARDLGELPGEADCALLAKRYQSHLNGIRFEYQLGMPAAHIAQFSEEIAQEIEALRR